MRAWSSSITWARNRPGPTASNRSARWRAAGPAPGHVLGRPAGRPAAAGAQHAAGIGLPPAVAVPALGRRGQCARVPQGGRVPRAGPGRCPAAATHAAAGGGACAARAVRRCRRAGPRRGRHRRPAPHLDGGRAHGGPGVLPFPPAGRQHGGLRRHGRGPAAARHESAARGAGFAQGPAVPGHLPAAVRGPRRATGAQHHGLLVAGSGLGPGRRRARAAGDRERRQPRGLVGRQPGPAPARHRHAGGAARDGRPHHHARHQLQGPVPSLPRHPGRRGGLPARARPRGLRGRAGLALVPAAQPARAGHPPGPGAGQLPGQRGAHRQRRGAGHAGLGDRHPAAPGRRRP